MIKIKPHHFLDIIKLYGKGIIKFVPDNEYKHSFYKVANEIISNKGIVIKLTKFCELLYSIKDDIFQIWKEETEEAKNNRYLEFCKGADKYLNIKF